MNMAEKTTSKCYIFTDGTDTVIAHSEKEADEVWRETIGDDHSEMGTNSWRMLPDDEPFTVMYEEWNGKIESGETVIPPDSKIERDENYPYHFNCAVTAPAGDWARVNKPCFLCSTEY